MGRAQGTRLRESAGALAAALRGLEAFRLQQPFWLPYPLYQLLAERKATAFVGPPLRTRHPDAWQRLCGIAEGSGLRRGTVVLLNALESALSAVSGCTAPLGACSALAVRGFSSPTAQPLIVRNFDYLPLVQPFYLVRESRPERDHAALEFTAAPLAGAVDGVNEKGLCITYNYAYTTDVPEERAVPISVLISEALARSSTTQAAIDWIVNRPRWGGGLLMIADRQGDLASLELSSTRSAVRRPSDQEDYIFHTNYFSTPQMREVQVPDTALYNHRSPTPLRGRRLHESAEVRDARFRDLLTKMNAFSEGDLARLMSDHGAEGVPGDNTICMHGNYWHTTATLQLVSSSCSMRVSFSTACQAEFSQLALA